MGRQRAGAGPAHVGHVMLAPRCLGSAPGGALGSWVQSSLLSDRKPPCCYPCAAFARCREVAQLRPDPVPGGSCGRRAGQRRRDWGRYLNTQTVKPDSFSVAIQASTERLRTFFSFFSICINYIGSSSGIVYKESP